MRSMASFSVYMLSRCIASWWASLSKLTKLWQEYIKHKSYVHMLLCGNVKELRRL